MASSDYQFLSHWRMNASAEEVYDILGDVAELARWWPASYQYVDVREPGDERGVGKAFDLGAKGWLPYVLNLRFRTVEADRPHRIVLQCKGDLEGRGIWTLEPDGEWVNITYDWKVRTVQPGLRYLSPILKPFFATNHIWTAKRGEESLRLELARRHAATPEERALVPDPPGPTTTSPIPLAMGFIALMVLVWALVSRVVAFFRRRGVTDPTV